MSEIVVHETDFEKYPPGAEFLEFRTEGGEAPGKIVVLNDGKKALCFSGVWLNYPDKFLALDQGGLIRVQDEIQMDSFRVGQVDAFVSYELTDGHEVPGPYVMAFHQKGRFCVGVWKRWFLHEVTSPVLGIDLGEANKNPRQISVEFQQKKVLVTVDGSEFVAQIPNNPIGLDTLRVRAAGLVTSADDASMIGNTVRGSVTYRKRFLFFSRLVTSYQFWLMLIRRHKVSGIAK